MNETELRVVEELLEWMKTEIPAGLSASREPTARALLFSPEPTRRRHESGGYSPSTFRRPSGRPQSEHSSPQQVHASTALTASALSDLLAPALQQTLPSIQINLDPERYDRTVVTPSLDLVKTLLPLQTTEFSTQIQPKIIDLLTNSLTEVETSVQATDQCFYIGVL